MNGVMGIDENSRRLVRQLTALAEVLDRPANVLALPGPLERSDCPSNVHQVLPGQQPEVIVLTAWNAGKLITSKVSPGRCAIVPVVNATDAGYPDLNHIRADVDVARGPMGLRDALAMLAPAIERLRSLPPSVLEADDPKLALLGRLFVRNRGLIPRRDPGRKETFIYRDECAIPSVGDFAEVLVELGFMRKEFDDTVLTCPRCDSGRMSVRERCPACGSANLSEVPIIRHLRCSHQAPEHEFRQQNELMCPKCRSALEYFSVDYDRPGSVSRCHSCGNHSGQSGVALLCLDCELDNDAADVVTRPIYRYYPTASGYDVVRNGSLFTAEAVSMVTPLQRIREFAYRQTAKSRPFCILVIDFAGPEHTAATRGHIQTFSLFSALIRETFTSDTQIIEDFPYFFVLLAGDSKTDVEEALPDIKRALEQHFFTAPQIRYRVFGPNEQYISS